jgi:hypothetical protein
MAREVLCSPFNGTNFALLDASQSVLGAGSPTTLTVSPLVLYVSPRERQMAQRHINIIDRYVAPPASNFFFLKKQSFFVAGKFRRVFSVHMSEYVGSLTC